MEEKFVNIHIHREENNPDEISLVNIFAQEFSKFQIKPEGFYSVGLHPWHLENVDVNKTIKIVERAAEDPRVAAIGETGIDRVISTDINFQTEIFIKHLEIAEKFQKPVVIHCVRCYSELISIKKNNNFQMPWIIHGFTANEIIAEQLLKYDCYLAFGKFLFNETSKVPGVFPKIPNEKFFFESDEENLPIEDIYKKGCELKHLTIHEMRRILIENFKRLFNNKSNNYKEF